MNRAKKRVRICGRVLFVAYLLMALYFMFFSESLDRTMINTCYRYNLTPFAEIKRFWQMRCTYGWHITIVNLLGNVVCFMPFGFLIPFISDNKVLNNVISVTIFSMTFSMIIETIQLLTKVGAFDVDDIILNTLGGFVGYIIFKISNSIIKIVNKREECKVVRNKAIQKKVKLKEKMDRRIPLKKYTKGGRTATLMAIINILVLILTIIISILEKGNAGIYVGFMMLAVLISAAVGFVIGINSFKEENKFLRFSYMGTVSNAVIWMGILGIYLIYV